MTILDAVITDDADLVADLLPSVSDNTLNQVYKDVDGKSYTLFDKARELSKDTRIIKMLMDRRAKSAKSLSRKSKSKSKSNGGRLPAKSRRNNRKK